MRSKIIKTVLLVVAIIGIAGYAGYITYENKKNTDLLNKLKTQSSPPADAEAEAIISAVTKLIDMPDEKPTIGTVSDVEKLKSQPFFSRAENGDKVLVYVKSQKAILYRPSAGKIIDIVPISDQATPSGKVAGAKTTITPTKSPTPTPASQNINILMLNGTTVAGLPNKFDQTIKTSIPQSTVIKDNAQKLDYEKSTIVVINPKFRPQADKLGLDMGIYMGETPYGEDLAGRADIAIIIGADKK